MTRYLTLGEILDLQRRVIETTGGATGLRDLAGLESAIAQPRASFGGQDLNQTLVDKAAALGFSLIRNHPFVDGNKRVGHAAIEVFLVLNDHEIRADVDEQEAVFLRVASGELDKEGLAEWLRSHVAEIRS